MGIMTAALVRHLLSESKTTQHIISLMVHFDLLCPYVGFEADELNRSNRERDFLFWSAPEEESFEDISIVENSDYFIPCLLELSSSLESEKTDAAHKTMPLLLSSAPLRIPLPLFYRILTHLCKRFPRLPVLYHNVGYFHIYSGHRLEFSLNRYSFQFTILSETEGPLNSAVCNHTREYIVQTIEKLKSQGMAGLQLHIGFQLSSAQPDTTDEDTFVSLDGFPKQRLELYTSKGREVKHPPQLSMWYPQVLYSIEGFSNVCLVIKVVL
jgi:hypothetical protein